MQLKLSRDLGPALQPLVDFFSFNSKSISQSRRRRKVVAEQSLKESTYFTLPVDLLSSLPMCILLFVV